jgi:acyl-coenzyme A thioesterase PaaI-like protein
MGAVDVDLIPRERFGEHVHARLLAAGPERSVVVQPDDPELTNHIGVRHAGALYAGAYEAARSLVLASLGELAAGARLTVAESRIAYEAMGVGAVTSVAAARGEAWKTARQELASGLPVTLDSAVVSTGPGGETVVTLDLTWRVEPA